MCTVNNAKRCGLLEEDRKLRDQCSVLQEASLSLHGGSDQTGACVNTMDLTCLHYKPCV